MVYNKNCNLLISTNYILFIFFIEKKKKIKIKIFKRK